MFRRVNVYESRSAESPSAKTLHIKQAIIKIMQQIDYRLRMIRTLWGWWSSIGTTYLVSCLLEVGLS